MQESMEHAPRLAIVVSRFNAEITEGLLTGAQSCLREAGHAPATVIEAPGAFEIPLIAQTLAQRDGYDGVICLGAVIKGDTAHFEYISNAASMGLMTASLATGVPLTFGILTTYDEEQAILRSRDDEHNKGREAAAACLTALRVIG